MKLVVPVLYVRSVVAVVPFHSMCNYFACQSDIDLNFDGDGRKSAILVSRCVLEFHMLGWGYHHPRHLQG